MEIERLLEIAQNLGFDDLLNDLQWLSNRMSQTNCPIVLPLVGEFSAGKTTLLNALTDNKKLETSFKATTATIYEIHFGCDSCYATVINKNGERKEFTNIEDLKNAELADAKVVMVHDTSTRVPSSTILVDTPGMSSHDPRHKQTLVNFLPKADGVLLVLDVNQGLPKSTIEHEFLKTIALSKRPIYAVFTQCDLKSRSEVNEQKNYLIENAPIPIKGIACVSGKTGDLQELYQLLDIVQKEKDSILQQVNQQRIKNISLLMMNRIDELLTATNSDKDLEEAVRAKKLELNKLNRNIDSLVSSVEEDIKHNESDVVGRFETILFDKLDSLVASKSSNFDAEAKIAINTTTSLMLQEYKEAVKESLYSIARSRRGSDAAVSLRCLEDVNVSSLSIHGSSYNLNLNELGHEYDTLIAGAAVAVAVVGAGVAGGYAAGAAGAFDCIDTATDVIFDGGSMINQAGTEITALKQDDSENANAQKEADFAEATQQNGNKPMGFLTGLVGLVTDSTMGKPQRRRAIHNYMDGTLVPNFKTEIKGLSKYLVSTISKVLHDEASQTIDEMTEALERLRAQLSEQQSKYQKRINELKNIKTELQNL